MIFLGITCSCICILNMYLLSHSSYQKKKKKSVEYARMGWLVVHPSDRDGLVGLFVRFALGDSDL